jgi:hypothetical protein
MRLPKTSADASEQTAALNACNQAIRPGQWGGRNGTRLVGQVQRVKNAGRPETLCWKNCRAQSAYEDAERGCSDGRQVRAWRPNAIKGPRAPFSRPSPGRWGGRVTIEVLVAAVAESQLRTKGALPSPWQPRGPTTRRQVLDGSRRRSPPGCRRRKESYSVRSSKKAGVRAVICSGMAATRRAQASRTPGTFSGR